MSIRPAHIRKRRVLVALSLAAAACQDQPVGPAAPSAPNPLLAELRCEVNVRDGTLACSDVASPKPGGASRNLLTYGRQGHYVRLASSGTTYNESDDVLASYVSVQNLLHAAIGTDDGSTQHASGVRVFFASEPTDGVALLNEDGTGTFTVSNQEYFQYSGPELGDDGILSPDETSAGKLWEFALNGAESFTFVLYVQAETPASASLTARFAQVSVGNSHSCGVTAAGRAYCWGSDEDGRLGNGSALTADIGVPTAVEMPAGVTFTSISAASTHTCALTAAGAAYCWGSDVFGRLGNGTSVTDAMDTPYPVTMPAGVAFKQISTASDHSCATGSDGAAYCWGRNFDGALGTGDTATTSRRAPVRVDMPAGVAFTSVAAGSSTSCALAAGGDVYCWGVDDAGALGNGSAVTGTQASPSLVLRPAGVTFTRVSAWDLTGCALSSAGAVYCWGSSENGDIGNGSAAADAPVLVTVLPDVPFTSLAVHGMRTCAGTDAGAVHCWGAEGYGGLGNGGNVDDYTPSAAVAVALPAGVSAKSFSLGHHSGCAVTAGSTYCWGLNAGRQVGDGTTTDRATPVVVAGTF